MDSTKNFHTPVLLKKSVELLINPKFENQIIVDGTTGGGGYSEEICKRLSERSKLICIDKDENALMFSKKRLQEYSKKIIFIKDNFGDIKRILASKNINSITGFVMDLGLSSYQLNEEDGFSYIKDTPLDMRANKNDKIQASDIINSFSKEELTNVFKDYGEIGNPERLSDAIVQKRKRKKITTTMQLVEVIKDEYKIGEKNLNKFLSKIFQAMRISVNNELGNLKSALEQSLDLLAGGSRLVVVSYHSLEDRIVKNFFREESYRPSTSKYKKSNTIIESKLITLTKKAITPDREEIKYNSKSRSAKLRAAERV
jgi:16S rRNA (cytosine1402-N4)-methyltransferase